MGMAGKKRGQPGWLAARHTAFGGDAIDPRMTLCRGKSLLITFGIFMVNQTQLKVGIRADRQIL